MKLSSTGGNQKRDWSNKYLCTNAHSSTIHNNPKVETTQMSFDGWKDKHNIVCAFSGILLNLKKEQKF